MPMNRKLYPHNWEEIALQIKEAAGWKCQECDRPCRRPGVDWEEFTLELGKDGVFSPWVRDAFEEVYDDETGEWGTVKRPQRFTLTVAHLNHQPEDCRPENLRALCAPCHCRYDLRAMATKRRLKAEREGQLTLFGGEAHAS